MKKSLYDLSLNPRRKSLKLIFKCKSIGLSSFLELSKWDSVLRYVFIRIPMLINFAKSNPTPISIKKRATDGKFGIVINPDCSTDPIRFAIRFSAYLVVFDQANLQIKFHFLSSFACPANISSLNLFQTGIK